MGKTVEAVKDSQLCCGCSCCKIVCPFDAISISRDRYGYKIPKLDESKCVQCELCLKCCPMSEFVGGE